MNNNATTQQQLTDAMPEPELTGHMYDGIEEYDNPTPGWWKWLFAASFFFAIAYVFIWHGGDGPSIYKQYDRAVTADLKLQFAELGTLEPTEATIVQYMHDDRWLAVGKSVFATNCISCHGADGQGKVGPNLTDDAWKNVTKIEDIARVLNEGAANGAMPAWKNRLEQNEIVLAASYVASLRGTNPSSPKAPEGNVIPDWPEYVPPAKEEDSKGDDSKDEPSNDAAPDASN